MEKEELAKREQEQLVAGGKEWLGKGPEADWGEAASAADWKTEGTGIGVGTTQQPISTAFAGTAGAEDWNVGPTPTKDWAADDAGDWGNAEPEVCSSLRASLD